MTMWAFFTILFNFFVSHGIVTGIVGGLLAICIIALFIFKKQIIGLFSKQEKKVVVRKKISEQVSYPIIKNFEMQFFDFTFSISELIYRRFIDIVLDEFRIIYEVLSIEMDKVFSEFNDMKLNLKLQSCTENRTDEDIQQCVMANKRISAKSKAYFQQYVANAKAKLISQTEKMISEDDFWNKPYEEFDVYMKTRIAILIQFIKDEEKSNVYSDDPLYQELLDKHGLKKLFELSFSEGFKNSYKKANEFIESTKEKLNVFETKFKEDFGDSFLTDWGVREKIIDKIGK